MSDIKGIRDIGIMAMVGLGLYLAYDFFKKGGLIDIPQIEGITTPTNIQIGSMPYSVQMTYPELIARSPAIVTAGAQIVAETLTNPLHQLSNNLSGVIPDFTKVQTVQVFPMPYEVQISPAQLIEKIPNILGTGIEVLTQNIKNLLHI